MGEVASPARDWIPIDIAAKENISGRNVHLRLSNGDEVTGVWDHRADYGNGAWGIKVGGIHLAIWDGDAVYPTEYRELEKLHGLQQT